MAEPAPRKFTMADLMILIAGCAAGIAWTQAAYASLVAQASGIVWGPWFSIPNLVISPSPILASIGLALLACQLRPPRPASRRLARRPGVVAIAGAAAFLACEAALILAGRGLKFIVERAWPITPSIIFMDDSSFVLTLGYAVAGSGPVVAACWLALVATGRWKPEPTWIDRSGRWLGACWFAVHLASVLANAMIY